MSSSGSRGVRSGNVHLLAGVGLALGVWALLPPYIGPALNTDARVEIVDHVVPGVAVLAIALATWVPRRRMERDVTEAGRRVEPPRGSTLLLMAGMAVALAGFWMTATHLPLIGQAMRAEAPWTATVFHSLPGLAVLILGGVWIAKSWVDGATEQPA